MRLGRLSPLLFVLVSLLPPGAWGSCYEGEDYMFAYGYIATGCGCGTETECSAGGGTVVWQAEIPSRGARKDCRLVGSCNSDLFNYCGWYDDGSGSRCYGQNLKYQCTGVFCTTQAEADSVNCVIGGKEWNGTSCASADSTGYACITFTKQTTWGGTYVAHRIYRMNYTTHTDELLEETGGSCQDRGFCGKIANNSDYMSDGKNCFEFNDNGDIGQEYGDPEESSSSSFDPFGSSSSSVTCKQTGQFMNTCYYECDNGSIGTCYGNDGVCDNNVSDCSWTEPSSSSRDDSSPTNPKGKEECDQLGGTWNGTNCVFGKEACEALGGTYTALGCQNAHTDYMGKLNEIIDTLHNNNVATRGTNAQLALISQQIENLNLNTVFGGGSAGLTHGQYDAGVAQIVEAQNGTQVKLDALGNVVETKFASSDSLMANGWRSIDYWKEFDSIQSVKQNENDSLRNGYLVRIDSVLTDTSSLFEKGDTSLVEVDFDSIEVWRPDTANAYLPDGINEDSVRNDFLSTLDTSVFGDSVALAQLASEMDVSEDSLRSLFQSKNDSLTGGYYDMADSAYGVWQEAVYNPFDSIIDRVLPKDSDHCPEECYKFDLNIPFPFGDVKADADFSKWLCSNSNLTWSGGKGVLFLIRILLRFLSAFSAIWIVFKFMGKSL